VHFFVFDDFQCVGRNPSGLILASISALSSSQGFGAAMTEVASAQQITAKVKRFMVEAPLRQRG
jgi:hypothetical protein